MRKLGFPTAGVIAVLLVGCGQSGKSDGGDPISLIKSGDAKACAHPAVIKTLQGVITTIRGNEDTLVPISTADIAKLELPAVTIDLISLASVDPTVHRVSCQARSVMIADIGGPSQRYEKEINYSITPSAQNDDEFIVTSESSIAADRINIGLVKKFAGNYQSAEADAATKDRLAAALQTANANAEPSSADAAQTAAQVTAKPSFDCSKASTKVEHFICGDADLAAKDQQVSATYRTWLARVRSGEMVDSVADIVADQKAWLKARNACGTAECVNQSYDARIAALPNL